MANPNVFFKKPLISVLLIVLAMAVNKASVSLAGTISWTGNRVVATGTGLAPAMTQNAAQARALGGRAAVVVARRNLLETVKGVRIDSTTLVRDFMMQSDDVASRVRGVIENSFVDSVVSRNDGSYQATVSIPLTGSLSRAVLPSYPALPDKAVSDSGLEKRLQTLEIKVAALTRTQAAIRSEQNSLKKELKALPRTLRAPVSEAKADSGADSPLKALLSRVALLEERIDGFDKQLATAMSVSKAAATSAKPAAPLKEQPLTGPAYTGLVIDARGTGFKPCLEPALYVDGKKIYPGSFVSRDLAVRKGFVRYYNSVVQAEQGQNAGSLPLTVKAAGVLPANSSALEIVIRNRADLQSLTAAQNGFLAQCQVSIIF